MGLNQGDNKLVKLVGNGEFSKKGLEGNYLANEKIYGER